VSDKSTGVWVALRGLNYAPGDKRAEPGDKVEGLTRQSIKDFLVAHVPPAIAPHDEAAEVIAARIVPKAKV
jgi:hypothetical protein